MAIKRKYLTPNTNMKLHKAEFQTDPTKNWKNDEKMRKLATFWAKKLLIMTL